MKKSEQTIECVDWSIRQCILEISHDYTFNMISEYTLMNANRLVAYIKEHLDWHNEKE